MQHTSLISLYYGTLECGSLQAAGTLTQESDAGVTRRQAMRLRTNPTDMKNTFRLFFTFFCTIFCILTIPSAPARAETLLVNSDNVNDESAIFKNAGNTLSQYTYNDNTSVAEWKLCEFKKNTAYTFTNTTNVVITSITFEGIADTNEDSKGGKITISDGTNSVSSSEITWNGRKNSSLTSLNIDVSSLSFSRNSTFTITTTYNLGLRFTVTYAAIKGDWVMDYSVSSGSWNRLYFSQVGTSTEWRSTIFSLPDAGQQFWVGPGSHTGHSVTKKFVDGNTVNFTFIGLQSKQDATNYYPGEGAVGYVRIYSNSESDNYYAAFEPTYQMAYGLDGDNWDFAPFHHVSGDEYETEIITIPSDFDTQTYKYYVGSKKADGSTIFINEKSSKDNLNTVNNLKAPANVKGTKGVFHIWSNSSDQNWYCEFKQYWNIILKGEDESVLYEKAVYSNADASEKSITIPADIQPEKEHYTFVGWNRIKGSSTATIKGGDSYGIYTTNDIFYPAYAANYYYILLNDDGSEFYRSEELVSTLSEAERTKTFHADTPTKEGYTFVGWTRTKESTSVAMSAGGDYTFWTANDTFYPVWEKNAEPEVWKLLLTKDGESTPMVYDFDVSTGNNIGTYTLSLPAGTTYDLKIKYGSTLYTLSNGQTLTGSFGNYNLCACSAYLKFVTTSYAGDYQFKLNYSSTTNPSISVTYPTEPTPCFSMKVTATSGSINGQTELTNDHASITGGTVFYARSSNNTKIEENGFLFGSDADSLRVTLADGALLAKNTTIKLTFTTNGTNRGIKLLAKDRKTEIVSITSPINGTTTDTVVTIKSDIETDVFYIVRATGNNTYLKSIELSGCGMLCVSPQLAWSAETAEGMLGGSITLPTLNNPYKLAGITYTSDNPKVATVDEAGNVSILAVGATDISATYAGDETYCEQTVTYTLTVQCAVAPTIQPTEGVIGGCNGFVPLTASPSDNSTYSGGAFQWYHNGKAIQGAASSTYTATAIGTYTVAYISTSGCSEMSTNSATITGEGTQPEVTCLTPFHYYRKGCEYTSKNDNPVRHLFKVVRTNTASDGKTWMPYARKISGNIQADMSNVTEWISANATNDTILLNMQTFAEKAGGSLSVGDTVVISVRPVDVCGNFSEAAEESIRLIVTEKDTRAVAYIVSGGNGNTITYGGDFLTGYNPNDLLAMNGYTSGKTSWSTDPDPLWYMLDTCKTYIATAVNGYAPFNKYNYEPFDLVLLTDFPKTDKNVGGQTGAPYLNDLAELVDSKPFLTLKAHMAKTGMDKWKALGFKATPLVPTSPQLTLDLICSQHTIFDRVKSNIVTPNATESDGQLTLLKAGGYDSGKGLQGFMARDMVGFMNIATIPYRNGSSDTLLVACCERQTNLDARLMVLSINAQAMSQLNTIGGNTILSMLDYLLIDDYADVQDCGAIFNNQEGDGLWSNTNNWQNGKLPQRATTAHIHANCVVDNMNAVAGELKIWEEATLTINANAALQVSDRIGYCDKTNRLKIYPITSASSIRIKADANGAGTLIHSASADWELPATVAYYSIASGAPTNCQWQWMTTPIHDLQGVEQYFYGAWLYEWSNEVHQWNKYLRNGDSMRPFNGYSLTQKTSGTTYTIAGNLVYAQDTTIALHYNNANTDGCNLIGNSWTAPINIAGFTADDFTNCEASIILFNTGLDPEGKGSVSESANNTTAGQYVSVPVNAASSLAKEIQVIPAMQTFQVNTTGEGASVRLRYNSLVRTYSSEGINRQPMRVAARNNYEGEGITDRLHIRVDGERFSDHVYLFRNADCTYGFDNGWDGTKMLGDERAVQLFAEQGENQWAVSTQPSLAGTQLGFYRGEDATYTMHFDYEGSEVLYLYDSETQRYTLIESGATYTFSSLTYDLEHRFLLTDYNPETPEGPTTGITHITVSGDQLSISHTGSEPLTISVYDAAGHTCLRLQTNAPLTTIPLPDTQGVYLIEALSASARITQKIVR